MVHQVFSIYYNVYSKTNDVYTEISGHPDRTPGRRSSTLLVRWGEIRTRGGHPHRTGREDTGEVTHTGVPACPSTDFSLCRSVAIFSETFFLAQHLCHSDWSGEGDQESSGRLGERPSLTPRVYSFLGVYYLGPRVTIDSDVPTSFLRDISVDWLSPPNIITGNLTKISRQSSCWYLHPSFTETSCRCLFLYCHARALGIIPNTVPFLSAINSGFGVTILKYH